MNCSEARLEIEALLDGENPSGELHPHLASCSACARELQEKRAFFGTLRSSIDRAMDGVESTPEERAGLAAKLSVRRTPILPRLAAAVAIVAILGIVAYVLGLFGRSPGEAPEVKEVAEIVAKKEQTKQQAQAYLTDLKRMTDALRRDLPAHPEENPEEMIPAIEWNQIDTQLGQMGSTPDADKKSDDLRVILRDLSSDDPRTRTAARKALRTLNPDALEEALPLVRKNPDQWCYVNGTVSRMRGTTQNSAASIGQVRISQEINGQKIEFTQLPNATIQIVIKEDGNPVTIEAKGMEDLLARHAPICKKWAISGHDGRVRIGASEAGVDMDQQINLVFTRMDDLKNFKPFRQEAYTYALRKHTRKNAREIDSKWAEVEKRMAEAEKLSVAWTASGTADVESALRSVRGLSPEQRRQIREQSEKELKDLDAQLKEIDSLRARIKGLRIYIEEIKQLKD